MNEPTPPVYYSASAQSPRQRNMHFYVRTAIDPAQIASAIRGAVASLDPNLPIVNLRTMQAQIDANMANERLLSLLTGRVRRPRDAARGHRPLRRAGVQRGAAHARDRHPHGARRQRAAGARAWWSARSLLIIGHRPRRRPGRGLRWPATLIKSVLFETQPADPWVFVSAAAVLGVIALAAAYVPVRRATGVDPMIALRYE